MHDPVIRGCRVIEGDGGKGFRGGVGGIEATGASRGCLVRGPVAAPGG